MDVLETFIRREDAEYFIEEVRGDVARARPPTERARVALFDNAHMSTLIINGPPGSGKSTVARLLADESPRGVHLHGDVFWHFIADHIPPGLPDAEEQNRTVVAALASAAVAYDRGGYEVFVDQSYDPRIPRSSCRRTLAYASTRWY